MDTDRFDILTKQLAQSPSRRRVLKTLGAAALGALGLAGAARPGAAQDVPGCTVDSDCDDGNPCTIDTCDPLLGCISAPVVCDDFNACTVDSCDPATGQCVFTKVDCDDQNFCTTDTCDAQFGCIYTAIDCDDGNPCTFDFCDATTGCYNTPGNNEGGACTPSGGGAGTCQSGQCICTPATSCPNGQTCGTAPDGCGGTITCGSCDASQCLTCGPQGTCVTTCASGQTCQGGQCGAPCPHGETRCGGACVSLTKDKNNCGGCGIRCGVKGRCANGVCLPK